MKYGPHFTQSYNWLLSLESKLPARHEVGHHVIMTFLKVLRIIESESGIDTTKIRGQFPCRRLWTIDPDQGERIGKPIYYSKRAAFVSTVTKARRFIDRQMKM